VEQAKLDAALLELKELDVAVCMAVSKVDCLHAFTP